MCLLTYLLIYVLILYRFLDKANCWSKIAIFSYPISASVRYPCRDIAVRFDMEKFMVMEKVGYVYRFDTIPAFARQTDRRTSCDSIVCAMRTHRAIKTACMCTKQPHYFSTVFIPTASDYGRIDCEREGRGRAGRPSREGWMRSLSNQYVTDCWGQGARHAGPFEWRDGRDIIVETRARRSCCSRSALAGSLCTCISTDWQRNLLTL